MMTYQEALGRLTGAKRLGPVPGLGTMEKLTAALGRPQDKLRFVHIAGTNGKGSIAAYTAAILRAAGWKTGLFISPFVQHFGERIQIDGEMIPEGEIARGAEIVLRAAEAVTAAGAQAPTAFELVTALGLWYFAEQGCDIVVFEVGLGGRLDATNIIAPPEAAVMAHIGLDHTELLGETAEEIAAEKAGIIKDGSAVVVYGQEKSIMDVFRRSCDEKGCPMIVADGDAAVLREISPRGLRFDFEDYQDLRTAMTGLHQLHNAVTAVKTAELLAKKGWKTDETAIRAGLAAARSVGRLEQLSEKPLFLVDGAHNPQGVFALAESLKAMCPGEKWHFLVGVLADKAHRESLERMLPLAARFYTVAPPNPRALPAEALAAELRELTDIPAKAFGSIPEALAEMETAGEGARCCAFGSLYQIGEIRSWWQKKK